MSDYIGNKATIAANTLTTGDKILLIDASATNTVGGTGDVRCVEFDDFSSLYEDAGSIAAHVAASDPHPQYLTSAEGNSAYQPLDSDLTSIAALTTTSFGRGLLTETNAGTARTTLGLGTAATQNTGTSGANVPIMSTINSWSGAQIFQAPTFLGGAFTVTNDVGGVTYVGQSFPESGQGGLTNFNKIWSEDYAGVGGDTRLHIMSESVTSSWAGVCVIGAGTYTVYKPSTGAGNHVTLAGSDAADGNTNGGNVVLRGGAKAGSGTDGVIAVRQPGGVAGTDEIQLSHDGTAGTIACKDGNLKLASGSTNKIDLVALTTLSCTLDLSTTNRLRIIDSGGSNNAQIRVGQCYLGGNSTNDAKVFLNVAADQMQLANNWQVAFSSGSSPESAGADVGISRSAAGVMLDTNGSSGTGARLTKFSLEANTAGVGSPNIILATETRRVFTNEGTTAQNYHTLPSAAAGLDFRFIVQDTDGIRVVADTGDTIRDVGTVSSAAGFIQSTTVGSAIHLIAINATEWIVVSKNGTWTIDS